MEGSYSPFGVASLVSSRHVERVQKLARSVELTQTLVDLGEAARSVRDLASYLERNPNALVVGRPGS